ncbi:hypothetical protein ACLOJK_026148 [Asimina triloba]
MIQLNFRPVRKARAFGIEFKQVHGVLFLREAGPQVPRSKLAAENASRALSCCLQYKAAATSTKTRSNNKWLG